MPRYNPAPLFDVDAFAAERPQTVKRLRAAQDAALGEATDVALPIDARRHNLGRMRAWIDELLARLDTDETLAHQPEPWRAERSAETTT